MKSTNLHIILIFLAAMVMSALGVSARKSADRHDNLSLQQDARKADYMFLEAKRQNLLDNNDANFELMDYALKLNPADPEIGMALGLYYFQLDSAGSTRWYDLMKRYVDKNPKDLYSGVLFASIAARTGRLDAALEGFRSLHTNFPEYQQVALEYAKILRQTGDSANLQTALAVYDTLAVTGMDKAQMAGMKTDVYLQMGDTAAIVAESHKLLDSSPNNSNYNLYVANIYHNLLHNDSALVYYAKAIELDPSNGYAYYGRAAYFNEANDSAAYDREVFDALNQNDLDLDVKLLLLRDYVAKLYTDSLQQPRISQLFDTLNDQHPHQAEISSLYCEYLIAIHDWKGAAEQASNALDLEPADLRKWILLSSLYLQLSEYDKMISSAQRGLHFFPDTPDLYQLKAVGEMNLKNYDQADSTFREAIDRVMATDSTQISALSELYTGMGDNLYQQGKKDLAFQAYEKALKYDPENLNALNNAAYYMACEGQDLDRALEMINKVVEAHPDESTSLDTYAWVLFKRKEYGEARIAIDKAIEQDDDPSEELFEHAGDIYFMDGEPDRALEFWKKALNLDPDNELLKRKVTNKTYFYK